MPGVRGVGIDLVAVDPFAEQVQAVGSVFAGQTFTAGELRAARSGAAGWAQHLAGRFAAKEAFLKAFSGARPGRAPVLAAPDWREIEVATDGWGRPALLLHGRMARAVQDALGPVAVHVSLTHEQATAAAVVVIEGA
jgi:holo-[acyl-carrier protein] synthase